MDRFRVVRESDLVVSGLSQLAYPLVLPMLAEPRLVVSEASETSHGLRLMETAAGSEKQVPVHRLGAGSVLFGATGIALLNRTVGSELIIGEQGRNRLTRLNPRDGSLLGHVADGWLRSPLAMLAYRSRLFVSDVCFEKVGSECIGRVVVYNAATLSAVRAIDSSALPPGERLHPHGLAALQARNGTRQLFVADADSGVVHVFSFRGVLLRTIGSKGTGPLQFIHPRGLLMLGHFLVVAERERVQTLYLPSGDVRSAEGVSSTQRLAFEKGSNFLGLCKAADRILIADVSKDRVAVLRMLTDDPSRAAMSEGGMVEQDREAARRIELRLMRRG